MIKCFNS